MLTCQVNTKAKSSLARRVSALQQDLFKKRECPGILRLSQPEERLLADFDIAMAARHLNQLRNPLIGRHLAEREDRALLHVRFGIVVDRAADGRQRLLAGPLRRPEERLAAHTRIRIRSRNANEGLRRWVA